MTLASHFFSRRVISGALALMLSAAGSAPALSAEDKVVAKVNGIEIKASELEFAKRDFNADVARLPADKRRAALVDILVVLKLVAKEATDKKLDMSDNFKARMEFLRLRALRNAFFNEVVEKNVTDKDLEARYKAEIAKVKPKEEIRARHILVKTEKEAKALITELKGGKDFVALAKEKSTGPSKSRGGDLGFFGKGQMVPVFEKAAFALKKGDVSAPVKSQFGWHVIKLEDKRTRPLPTFKQVKPQLRQLVLSEKVRKAMSDLRSAAKIEYMEEGLDPTVKPAAKGEKKAK